MFYFVIFRFFSHTVMRHAAQSIQQWSAALRWYPHSTAQPFRDIDKNRTEAMPWQGRGAAYRILYFIRKIRYYDLWQLTIILKYVFEIKLSPVILIHIKSRIQSQWGEIISINMKIYISLALLAYVLSYWCNIHSTLMLYNLHV